MPHRYDRQQVTIFLGERDDRYAALRGGHRIAQRITAEYAAWCAICRRYVPITEDENDTEWWETDIDAITALATHTTLKHPDAETDRRGKGTPE